MADAASRLEGRLGYSFRDQELLQTALTHRSAVAEGEAAESFERLEFLGDAVLDLVVAELLYAEHPGLAEGEMAKTRAAVVGEPALAAIAETIGVGEAVILGIGEQRTGGRNKASILSDAIEAIIGAIYLDGGFDAAAGIILRYWRPEIDERVADPGRFDFKSRLQEAVAPQGQRPEYASVSEGPDHDKTFTVTVTIDGAVVGTGVGTSKKRAEQEAARLALEAVQGA